MIVEIHGGFQFSDVASEFAIRAAHAAIDAGADLVVGHHPHVLQGFEWYKGHLIAYSLGNFVFDQDFLSTFPSVILRTIFEGNRMIDARIIPLTIDRYQPVPVVGCRCRAGDPDDEQQIGPDRVQRSDRAAHRCLGHRPAAARLTPRSRHRHDRRDHGSARQHLTGELSTRRLRPVPPLPPCAIVRTGSFDGEIGVDLLQWGDIDDDTADNSTEGATQWALTGNVTAEVEDENQFLRLLPTRCAVRRHDDRPLRHAAAPLVRRRLRCRSTASRGYSVQMRTRGKGVTDATLRVAVYDVNDTDPTTEPVSTLLHETRSRSPVPDSADWQEISISM